MTVDDNEDLGKSLKSAAEALANVKITTVTTSKMNEMLADPTEDHRYLRMDDAMKRQLSREMKYQHDYYNDGVHRRPDPTQNRELEQVVLELAQEVRRSSFVSTRACEAMEKVSRQTAEILDKYITDLAIANKSAEVWRDRYEALLEHQGG